MNTPEKIYKSSKKEWHISKEVFSDLVISSRIIEVSTGNVSRSIVRIPEKRKVIDQVAVPKTVPGIINYLKSKSNLIFAQDLARRLEAIVESFQNGEEFEEQEEINASSLQRAIIFLEKIGFSTFPSLIITFEGYTKLVWESKNTFLEITPQPNRRTAINLISTNQLLEQISKKVMSEDHQVFSELEISKSFLFEIL